MVFKKRLIYRSFLSVSIFLALIFLFLQNSDLITGYSSFNLTSNVTLNKFLSVDFSEELTKGIFFGSISNLPSENTNATKNYNSSNNGTMYYINVSTDSNTNVDFCIKGSANLVSHANDAIGLANETYSNSTSTNSTIPFLSQEISLTTSYAKSGDNIPIGGFNYYRFWLDIPIAQPSGDYNNTIYFKAVQTGINC
jgi:hypothetical protein